MIHTEAHCRCAICGCLIGGERLEAVPRTWLCIDHARAISKHGGEFRLRIGFQRTSKAGSLKINYGGVSVTFERNWKALNRLQAESARVGNGE